MFSLAESAPRGNRNRMHPQQIAIYKMMSPAEKLRLAAEFNASARNLKKAALKKFHPDWTEEQVQKKLRDLFLYASV